MRSIMMMGTRRMSREGDGVGRGVWEMGEFTILTTLCTISWMHLHDFTAISKKKSIKHLNLGGRELASIFGFSIANSFYISFPNVCPRLCLAVYLCIHGYLSLSKVSSLDQLLSTLHENIK